MYTAATINRTGPQHQVDRYTRAYGPGALVYRHGYCESLRVTGALKLSMPLAAGATAQGATSVNKARRKGEVRGDRAGNVGVAAALG